jgi:hypothetical protein
VDVNPSNDPELPQEGWVMAVTRKVVRVDIDDLAQKFAIAAEGYRRGDRFDVEKFAKDHNVTTDIITKHVYNRALLKHGIEPLELVTSPSSEDQDVVRVNAKNCIILKKGQHPFPQDMDIKIHIEGSILTLAPSEN